jgi:Tol biopolymer transport system component
MEPEKKNKFKFSRKQLITIGTSIFLIILMIIFYRLGIFQSIYHSLNYADVTVSVLSEIERPVARARIELKNLKNSNFNQNGLADKYGNAYFSTLLKGEYEVLIKAEGYQILKTKATLRKGKDNALTFRLVKNPAITATVTGIVKDYVSEAVIKNASVKIADKTVVTDENGKFTVENVVTGDYEVSINNVGYLPYNQKVSILTKQSQLEPINLVPEGKIAFVTNRDKGKRAIYTANYDGSEQKSIVARAADYEDFSPLVSPDKKKVVFVSTREGRKDENGNLINLLYLIDIDGKNLIKVSDLAIDYNFRWTNDNKFLIWQSQKGELHAYNVTAKTDVPLVMDLRASMYDINPSNTKIAFMVYEQTSNKSAIYTTDISGNPPSKIIEEQSGLSLYRFLSDSQILYSVYSTNRTKHFIYDSVKNTNSETDYASSSKQSGIKSPDGKLIAYIDERDGKNDVFISLPNGNDEKQLTNIGTAQGNLTWSNNNTMIIFTSYKPGESALYIVSISGGKAKKIVDIAQGYGYGG